MKAEPKDKLEMFIFKQFIPFIALEDYMKSLSTRKLIKVAEKVLAPGIKLYGPQEAVYEEMITRLKDKAKSEEMVKRIINVNRGKF